jgi:hypothetical protein
MWKVNGRWTPSDGKSSHCRWQGELKNKGTIVFTVVFSVNSLLFVEYKFSLLFLVQSNQEN